MKPKADVKNGFELLLCDTHSEFGKYGFGQLFWLCIENVFLFFMWLYVCFYVLVIFSNKDQKARLRIVTSVFQPRPNDKIKKCNIYKSLLFQTERRDLCFPRLLVEALAIPDA